MKSVLISIQPKWCELIASGKKTVEVRKTKPKLETPFKVYIYCTSSNIHECLMQNESGVKLIVSCNYKTAIPCGGHIANGKVIGEFLCDEIDTYTKAFWDEQEERDTYDIARLVYHSRIKYEDFRSYVGEKDFYAWHISDLVIYDEPRELGEFFHYCGDNPNCDGCEAHYYSNTECGKEDYCCSIIEGCKPLKRPFQSWGYVYEADT